MSLRRQRKEVSNLFGPKLRKSWLVWRRSMVASCRSVDLSNVIERNNLEFVVTLWFIFSSCFDWDSAWTNREVRWCRWRPWPVNRTTWRWSARERISTSCTALHLRPSTNIPASSFPSVLPASISCTGSSTSTSQRSQPRISLYTIPILKKKLDRLDWFIVRMMIYYYYYYHDDDDGIQPLNLLILTSWA